MRPLLALVALLAVACSTEPDVDWEQYETGLQSRIDRLADEANCDALEQMREAATESRLKRYVYQSMRDAGCY